jgi:hypothetical protein
MSDPITIAIIGAFLGGIAKKLGEQFWEKYGPGINAAIKTGGIDELKSAVAQINEGLDKNPESGVCNIELHGNRFRPKLLVDVKLPGGTILHHKIKNMDEIKNFLQELDKNI